MTTTLESGRHVTPERIRKGAEVMERAGFRLRYETPLAELQGAEEEPPDLAWSWWECQSWDGFSESIPGEQGRMA